MKIWGLIAAMALVTFATRYALFARPDVRFPPKVARGLRYVPTAVLTAIVVPGMVMPDGSHWQLSIDNAYLIGGLATAGFALWRRTLLLTIGGGLLVFFAWRALHGQLPL